MIPLKPTRRRFFLDAARSLAGGALAVAVGPVVRPRGIPEGWGLSPLRQAMPTRTWDLAGLPNCVVGMGWNVTGRAS